MASPFDRYRQTVIGITDAWMAEELRHFPLKNEREDADREKVNFNGRLHVLSDDPIRARRDFNAMSSSAEASAFFSKFTHPDLVIRQGDKIQALDRAGQPFFRVSNVSDAGTGRIMVSLEAA